MCLVLLSSFQGIKPITQFVLKVVCTQTVYFIEKNQNLSLLNAEKGCRIYVLLYCSTVVCNELVMCHVLPVEQVKGMDNVHVILGIGFVLLSLTLLVLLSYTLIKRLMKRKTCKLTKTDIIMVEGADLIICFHLYRVQKSSLLLDNIVILLLYNLLCKYKILSEYKTNFTVYNQEILDNRS